MTDTTDTAGTTTTTAAPTQDERKASVLDGLACGLIENEENVLSRYIGTGKGSGLLAEDWDRGRRIGRAIRNNLTVPF